MMKRAVQGAVVLGVILVVWFIHKTGVLGHVVATIDRAGVQGPFIFLVVYMCSCLFLVPSSIFAFSGGMLFGFWRGAMLSALGNGLGSVAAFWIGRYLARRWVESFIARNASFQKFAGALARKGWKIVLLARLSPVFPFSVGNYAFGTTRIPAWQYGAASTIGTIPSAMVYAYLGALTGDISLLHSGTRPRTAGEWALLILGLIATVALFFVLRRAAQKALEKS